MSSITIGFTPRERFSEAPEALRRILQHTHIEYKLVVVDCNTPRSYWEPMEQMLRERHNVKIIRRERYLLPNQCRNLILPEVEGDFVCLIENDVLVEDGWLKRFVESAERHVADVVIPLIMEGEPGNAKVHFDEKLGSIRSVETAQGTKLEIIGRPGKKEEDVGSHSRPQQFMETHCLFFRSHVLEGLGPFDEEVVFSDEVDVSMAIRAAGVSAIFDPDCTVNFVQPPVPVHEEDRAYFTMRWDLQRGIVSAERLQSKWNLNHEPQLLGFLEERNLRGTERLALWRDELATIISPQDPFILVDLEQWTSSEVVAGLQHIPFLERHGQYWGPPPDDETALREFERLHQEGARFIVFAWHGFWFLEHYSEFDRHLRSQFPCVLQNHHMMIFDLRRPTPSD